MSKQAWGSSIDRIAAVTFAVMILSLGVTTRAQAASTPSPSQNYSRNVAENHSEIVIDVGKSRLIQLPYAYTDVMIGDPKIADVVPLNPHAIYLVGKGLGSTRLTVYGVGKTVVLTDDVVVSADIDGLKSHLHQILPNEVDISVRPANRSIVIAGTVSSPAVLQQVLSLAETYSPGKVVNMMSVQGTQQVMLSVRFVEMDRTAAKNLGLNVQQTPTKTEPQVSLTSGEALLNAAQSAANTFATGSLLWKVGGGDLTFLFDALESKGLAQTLAEPTLVTMSGDTANFLAGGEIPIPVPQSASGGTGSLPVITIEYKEFGVALAFTPTLLQDGLINLVVNPEVSSIDPTTSIQIDGISVPGFKKDRAHTTIELRDGESFTIAGLLSDNYQSTISQLPFVGDVPILGTLFRSSAFQRAQTELVIVVTPHLVTPRHVSPATPADQFVPPSDFELFLFGAERGDPSNLRPEDRVLMSLDPSKGGVEGPYGHVLY